ncbi:MAG: ion transporter [Chitinophagales bacterium]|jgi:inward rectifier potassium channel|nr:ion transporter [Chitinophagales bacterium]HNI43654.1 ion channel [Chitinophagales bacterium]
MNKRLNRLLMRNRSVSSQEDSGFGKSLTESARLVNTDGSFNVHRIGASWSALSVYQWLLTIDWLLFVAIIIAYYIASNLLFAQIYYWIGVQHLKGIEVSESAWDNFWHCFFFSIQTYTTIGYGAISPNNWSTNVLVAVEALVGVLTGALITGLLFGRFSRPSIRLGYSENILIAPTKDSFSGLMCRIVNLRSNRLVEVEAQMMFSYIDPNEVQQTGKRIFVNLPLQVTKLQYFPLSWTLHHVITEESPLWGLAEEDFANIKAEFMIMLKAFDDTFMQTLYTNTSYTWEQLVVGAKFVPMFYPDASTQQIVLDYQLLSRWERADLVAVS